jgi:hypothetical protein
MEITIIIIAILINIYINYLIRKHILFKVDEYAKTNPIGKLLVFIPAFGTICLLLICAINTDW